MMILAPTNRRIIRPDDKPSFEHTQRYGLIKGHWANTNRVGLWLYNEGSGGQVFDLSRNGNTGSIINALWTSGKFGSCLSFNGTSAYVDIGRSPSINITSNKVSYMAWIYPTAAAGVRGIFGPVVNETTGYGITVEPTTIWLYIYTSSGTLSQNTGISVSLNTWTHLAVVYDGFNAYLYKNGTLVGNWAHGGNIYSVVGNIGIGIWRAYEFEGKIDVPLIYNRALSASEIALLYREPFLGIQREPRITYFFVPTGGVVYQELNLTVTADASAAETDTHAMVDTGKAVQADAAVTESDTQQMVETGKEVSVDASVSCTDLKVVFELNLTVNAAGSVVATEAHTMMETGKSVTAVASPAVIDTQTMLETGLGVSAEGSVSCTDTMGLLAHIAAFMILRQCTT